MSVNGVGIDGYDLTRPDPTGAECDALTLGRAIRAIGRPLHGLFGIDVGTGRETREILFHDRIGSAMPTARRPRAATALSSLRGRSGSVEALAVPVTGLVEKRGFDDQLPRFDALWSAGGLFDIAFRQFSRTGRLLTVRLATPPAIMHWTRPLPLVVAGVRNVYTVSDTAALDAAGEGRALLSACVAHADYVCTPSDAAHDAIVAAFPALVNRVTTIPRCTGPTPDATADENTAAVAGLFGLPSGGYVLLLGRLPAGSAIAAAGTDMPIAIVGEQESRGHDTDRQPPTFDRLSPGSRLTLMRGARVVVLSAADEAMASTALDALQFGTVLVVVGRGPLSALVGDAALTIGAGDLASTLARIAGDTSLRSDLAERGRRRAALFSPARYEARLAALYETVLAAPSRSR